ncbi:MAG TPA: hypothetical protein VMU47_12825 [Caldimonas sp.]|nr:hypothetical protein [Caldimonas sp.]
MTPARFVDSPRLAHLLAAWERMPAMTRGFGVSGLLLAFGLLVGFYIVVAGAVHRAELGRERARLALDHQAACAAFTEAQMRDLCALTVPAPHQRNVARAVYEPAWRPARAQMTAGAY